MDGQTAEEGDGTSDFKGWSIRPHQDPTRVSINRLLLALKINLGEYEDYRFAWQFYSTSFS